MTNDKSKKYAIYSRKSKFTGTGESTTNQIDICKNRLIKDFNATDEDIIIYEDEGFSGYNINRPSFNRLLNDIKNNSIKVLIFYKLDRISRNVNDFTKLVTLFDKHNVKFLSATENIESITPTGKAMMYMISVFAELERDTIAERIKDNMLELAKTGRWLGGTTPTGYSSTELYYISSTGKRKKLYNLKLNEESEKVKLLYKLALELKSLTKIETYTINNNIYTSNNHFFTRWTINNILRNPVYATSDKQIYNYFKDNGANIYNSEDEFTGEYGLMVYNKTENKKYKVVKKDMSKWIIAIGKHKGIITGSTWIEVQKILDNNKNMITRKCDTSKSLFSGLIKCSLCNNKMRPKNRKNTFDYICTLKEKSHKKLCNAKNINGDILDEAILKSLFENSSNDSKIAYDLEKLFSKRLKTSKKDEFQKKYENNNKMIKELIDKIKYVDKTIIKDINNEILKLKKENENLLTLLSKPLEKINYKEIALNILSNYKSHFKKLDSKTKRLLINSLIESITINQNEITIYSK